MEYKHNSISNVASVRSQIEREETAARLGVIGLAITSRHEFINARAERGAARILQLVEQGQYAEAQALMDMPDWGIGEEKTVDMSHFDSINSQ